MPKPRNLSYDGVGHNADWVASIKTEKQFLARPEVQHLYPDKSPEARTEALKEVYALCRQLVNPLPEVPAPSPAEMPSNDNQGGE